MKQLFFTLLLISLLAYTSTQAQNVGIGTTTPNASAILDVSSTTKGFLLPRMSTAQRNAVASPAVGLSILNTDDMCTDIYDGTNWIKNCGLKQGDSAAVAADNWIKKANFGGIVRLSAVGFSIGSKGYIGTGYQSTLATLKKDFWEYDPALNIWTQKADFGGTARFEAVGFSISGKGYIGTGNDGSFTNDFWEYNPTTNAWTQKANFGGTSRYAATGFSIGGTGYIGTGTDGNDRNDFWEYNPITNVWTQKVNFGGIGRSNAIGFSIGSKGYIGMGGQFIVPLANSDFWEFDPGASGSLGTWSQKMSVPANAAIPAGASSAVGFSIGNKGYIGTGYQNFINQNGFFEYDPIINSWQKKANFIGAARSEAVGFSIGSKGYIGTGAIGSGNYENDFWEYNTQAINVATYSTVSSTISQANISDGIWTKTVIGEIKSSVGNVNIAQNGNVGIGTTTPNAALQFANTTNNRKIVLFDEYNNDHLYSGFGLNTDALRYQVSGFNIDHTFYAGISTTTSKELMRIKNNGNVGIGTSTPTARLHVQDSSVVFTGQNETSIKGNPPISGTGGRMMWYADKSALRSGYVASTNWDKDSIGYGSIAAGYNTKAKGIVSTSFGSVTSAIGPFATSMGANTIASGFISTSMGNTTTASGNYTTSMGYKSVASGNTSISMGDSTIASGDYSTSIGSRTIASSFASTSMGYNTVASSSYTTSMGVNTKAIAVAATSMGNGTTASGNFSTSMGSATTASGFASTSMGLLTKAKATASLVIGKYNDTTATNRLFEIGNGFADNARSNALTVLENGNVGVGTTNPTYKLHLGNANSSLRIEGPAAAATGGTALNIGGNGDIVIDKPGVVGGRLVIKEDGDVGVGSATPSAYGHGGTNRVLELRNFAPAGINIQSHLVLSSTANAGAMGGVTWASTSLTGEQRTAFIGTAFETANQSRISLYTRSNAGSLAERFYLSGDGNAWLQGTLAQSSDMRLKKNIVPLHLSLNKLTQLNGYTYNWISKDKDPSEQIGLIAQEVQKLYPQLVSEIKGQNGETTLAVNYTGLIPVLIEGMKEQQKQIDELKGLVQKLLTK